MASELGYKIGLWHLTGFRWVWEDVCPLKWEFPKEYHCVQQDSATDPWVSMGIERIEFLDSRFTSKKRNIMGSL